ncbi:MAG: Na+/H+ antiporter NhaC family protein, partial [Candidatus Krumholzibacteria bacterium]
MSPTASRLIPTLSCFAFLLTATMGRAQEAASPLKSPKAIISGIATTFEISAASEGATYSLEILKDHRPIYSRSGILPATLDDVVFPGSGVYTVRLVSAGTTWESTERAFPGFFSLLPPLLAIVMALIFRQVVIALFAGVWLGAFFVNDSNPIRSFFYVVDHYVIDSLAGSSGSDHVSIAIFTLLLGGMVGVFSCIGGTQGVVDAISKIATTPRRGQLATWLMGIAVFFDDYTNTLIVGNTMRPITDRLKISREKLSYIVDSTAAPVACIAVITSWIGFEISLIKDAFDAAGIDRNPFTTFVSSIQYSFYPVATLIFGLLIAATTRDFGPMRRAEKRSRTRGLVLGEKAVPLSNVEQEITFGDGAAPRWYNAAIPIAVVVIGTFVGLVVTGRNSLLAAGAESYSLMDAIKE